MTQPRLGKAPTYFSEYRVGGARRVTPRRVRVLWLAAVPEVLPAPGAACFMAEKAAASHALQSDNQDLREAQFDHKVRIDEGELEVLRRSTTDVRGIASPTG